ncbi:hypothetical protein MMC30_002018 [Trapelia coarctata]|nr:hypothetical protein [Trapelia coarctata]
MAVPMLTIVDRYHPLSVTKAQQPSSPKSRPRNPRVDREFDSARYSTRFIALKFAYLGQRYNGFEYHNGNKTPLPTIEEELWKALRKAHLIFPTSSTLTEGEINWEGCEYSKCGRTDRGVSAFGQVIGIRVRSNRPPAKQGPVSNVDTDTTNSDGNIETVSAPLDMDSMGANGPISALALADPTLDAPLSFHSIHDEISYPQLLNRVLPPDIRVLAWCPVPPVDFSARFSCKERRYRYFFTQPAFNPTYGAAGLLSNATNTSTKRRDGWLDIQAMNEGAKRFEGLHDFRNFCKVDASKQIDNFERRIFLAEIREVDHASEPAAYVSGFGFREFEPSSVPNGVSHMQHTGTNGSSPRVYMFVLHGSAFLWHQVRHMVAVLFLIGQGLEPPEIIDGLLDVEKNPQKPLYEMAEDAPLVLWDCIFPREGSASHEDAVEWVYIGDQPHSSDATPAKGHGKFGLGGVVDDVWKIWRQKKMDEVLAGMLLNLVVGQGNCSVIEKGLGDKTGGQTASRKVFYGGDSSRPRGKYTPLLQRPRMESVETINARFATRKGFNKTEETCDTGFRKFKLLQEHGPSD